ncbi:hypothetical protein BROUX41_006119 [Berkeleyomyces rouxiae]|uniref:uncharacterized protein n=1 Tax=Berkeleyomyces rouxiae TaxID=2035830 RepID=UPI003B7999FE
MAAAASSKPAGGKVTLKVSPEKLRALLHSHDKPPSPLPDLKPEREPSNLHNVVFMNAAATDAAAAAAALNGDAAVVDSATATPGQPGTPSMAPPAKKGVKRAAPGANGEPRDRKKPGPKKKKLDDGETRSDRSHKLGPKANQGAINAGLRALDRSGKPCRKWVRGNFTLKSFTGVTWEITRWTTPAQAKPETGSAADASATEQTNGETSTEVVDTTKAKGKSAATTAVNGVDPATHAPAAAVAAAVPVTPSGDKKPASESKTENQDVEMQDASSSVPSMATNSPLPQAIAAA